MLDSKDILVGDRPFFSEPDNSVSCVQVALLLHEAVLLLGLFATGNSSHQIKLLYGPAPSLLQRLCAVPAQYLLTTPPCSCCIRSKAPQGPCTAASASCDDMHDSGPIDDALEQCTQQDASVHALPRSQGSNNDSIRAGRTGVGYEASADSDLSPVAIRSSRVSSDNASVGIPEPRRAPSQQISAAQSHAGYACTCGLNCTPASPGYLQHVLYPTLLASCLDAPHNCQAVMDALGAQCILDYCSAHAPPRPGEHRFTSASSSHTRTLSPSTPASLHQHARRNSFGSDASCLSPTAAVMGTADHMSAAGQEFHAQLLLGSAIEDNWHVDLGPLDSRFHPQHRIQACAWWRAHDQIMAASDGRFLGGGSVC
jgi:hypothetical protein